MPHPSPDLDAAVSALVRDLGHDIAQLCEEQHAIKVWILLYVRDKSVNPEKLGSPKNLIAKLFVKSTDFYYCRPDIYHYNIMNRLYNTNIELLGTQLFERNGKFIRDQSFLSLTDKIKLHLNCALY